MGNKLFKSNKTKDLLYLWDNLFNFELGGLARDLGCRRARRAHGGRFGDGYKRGPS